jgi:hypothetical protein
MTALCSGVVLPYTLCCLAGDDERVSDTKGLQRITQHLEMAVFWVVAPCSLVEVYQRFRGPCCLPHQGVRLHGATTQKTAIFVLTAVRTSNPTQHLLEFPFSI